jgi:hypothetical protein
MATQVKHRRGTDAEIMAGVPAIGELWFNTTDNTIHMGDGVTQGGNKHINENTLQKYTHLEFDSVSAAVTAVAAGQLSAGSKVVVNDYYGASNPNGSGVLFFTIENPSGDVDGGKRILAGSYHLVQNLKRPYSCLAWGVRSDAVAAADNDTPLQNWLNYRGSLYAPQGNYNHTKPLIVHSGTVLTGDGVVIDQAGITLPDGSVVSSSDLITTFYKEGNDTTGGADASFILGDNESVKYITFSHFQVDSDSNVEFAFWRGLEASNLEASSVDWNNIVIRNHQKGSWIDKGYLNYYRQVVMGGGLVGIYSGYNNSTSTHIYDCYMNAVATGYWLNSVYSSINNSAADKADSIGYRLGNGVVINNCGCEFPATAILAQYTSDPVIVNKMKIIAKEEGTTVLVNYDGDDCANVIFNDTSISANETAKPNLVIANLKGVAGKPRSVQFINTYVDTYVAATDNTVRTPLWDYGFSKIPTDNNVSVIYGPSNKQKFITEALGTAGTPTRKYVLIRLAEDGDYEIVFNKPFGDSQSAYLPEGRLATVECVLNGGYVALKDFTKFHTAQDVKFFTKSGDDKAIYLQYEQQNDVGNGVTVTISGGMAEDVYNLQQIEAPGDFTQVTPFNPI